MSKSRAFCFTDFTKDKEFYNNLDPAYMIIGEEVCPSTNMIHWQGYIRFNNQRHFNQVQKQFQPRHIEICKGSSSSNIKYCSKDHNIVLEIGERPKQGKRSDLEAVAELVSSGATLKDIAEEHPTQVIKFHKGIEKLIELKREIEPRSWKTNVIVLWGGTGTGKTKRAIDDAAVPISWNKDFFLNYDNQPIILLDDFDPADMDRRLFLNLTDRYPLTVNVKFGAKVWNPKTIYITSNFNPDSWYGGDKAVLRRLDKIIWMDQK